jgi:predicted DsbA family dithiol-disulfide isomerase
MSALPPNDDKSVLLVWSDVVCPFCYLGSVWIQEAAEKLGVRTRWLPFELHPEVSPNGADKPFSDADWPMVRARLLELAKHVGLPIDPPRRNANSRLALETMELVRSRTGDDAAASFHHAVSRAFFVDGANVADPELIAAEAAPFGIAKDDVESAWQRHAFAPAVDTSIAASRAAGVRGVPAYGWPGRRAISGMMEPEQIIRALA